MVAFSLVLAVLLYGAAHLLLAIRDRLGLALERATLLAMAGWMLSVGIITYHGISSDQWSVFLLAAGSILLVPCANHLRYQWTNERVRRLLEE